MADNQVTVEQLLRGLGQAMLQMSDKMDVLAAKLDEVREEVSKASSPAPAPGEGFFEAQFARLEAALSRPAPDGEGQGGGSGATEALLEKLEAVRHEVSAIPQPAAAPGEGFFEAQFGRLESAFAQLSMKSGEAGQGGGDTGALLEALNRLDSSLASMAESVGAKLDAMAAVIAEKRPDGEPADQLPELLNGLGDLLEKLMTEVNQAVSEAGARSAAGITEASGFIIDAIGSIPESVKTMQASLSEKADGLRRDAAQGLEQAEAARKNAEKALEDMGKTGKKTEKAIEEVKAELSRGLEKNGKLLAEMQEVTERFAGKALEDGIRQLNLSAIHHYNIGEYQAAVEDLREAIHLDANRAEVWCNLAHAQAALTQDADAEASFRKALELQPDLDQAVSGLGVLMLAGGRTGDSIAFLEKFMASETPSVRTMIAYSRALAGAGRHADAVETLERAASLAPDNPEVTAELQAYTGDKAN